MIIFKNFKKRYLPTYNIYMAFLMQLLIFYYVNIYILLDAGNYIQHKKYVHSCKAIR